MVVDASIAQGSFTRFVEEVEPRLRVALVARFGPEDGRDATADALAYGWEHWERVRVMENPAGYLFRVGQHAGMRRWRRPALPLARHQSQPEVEPALPKALTRLSHRQRTTVLLVHGFGWTQEEVADLLGVSPSTVRNHLRRGMSKLRATLGGVT